MENNLKKIDLHIHTIVSDGTDTPSELITKVKEAGISVFSVTDHDAVKGGSVIREHLKNDDVNNPVFIQGAEFSCKDEEGKYHILGYGFDPEHEAINGLVNFGHDMRMKKVAARIDFLKEEFGFSFLKEDIDHLLALDNPGKPHIANLMVKYGYVKTKEIAFKDYINKIKFKNDHLRPEQAIEGIIASGGIPVLAHPFYGSGDELILGEEIDMRLKKLVGYGIQGLEGFYSGYSPKLRNDAIKLAGKYDLYITAGSDYHGRNKMIMLGDIGAAGLTEYPEGLKRFIKEFC